MFSAIAAYALTFFIIAPLSGFIPTLIALPFGLILPLPKLVSAGSALSTAFVAYYLTKTLFGWFDVHFAWYSFLIAFVPILINDLRRAAAEPEDSVGVERAHVVGDIVGCIAVLMIFFLE